MERIDSSFTKTLHKGLFKPVTFQTVNEKLKPFLTKITDFELFRRNVLFVSIYSELVKRNPKIKTDRLLLLVKLWMKWLVKNESFRFIPICHFLNKNYPSTISKEKLESIMYLHQVIVDELAYLNNPDIKKLFTELDLRVLKLYGYSKIKINRTFKIASFESVEKELLAFFYVYTFSTFQGTIEIETFDLITQIMHEEGLDLKYFQVIEREMVTAGLTYQGS